MKFINGIKKNWQIITILIFFIVQTIFMINLNRTVSKLNESQKNTYTGGIEQEVGLIKLDTDELKNESDDQNDKLDYIQSQVDDICRVTENC